MEKVLNEVKKFVTKPVTNLMEKEQKEEIKVSAIKTLVVAAVAALSYILIMINAIESSFKVYSAGLSLLGGADSINQAKGLAYASADLFGWFIKVFFGIILLVVIIAGIFFAVSKLMKVKKEFKNCLALAANYSIYLGVGLLLYALLAFIYAPIATGALILVSIFSSYAIKYAYKNSLGDGIDDDKLTIIASLVVSVVIFIAFIVLSSILATTFASSLSGLSGSGSSTKSVNSLNSLKDLLK